VLLEGEEEIGSPRIADFVRDHADRLKADLVVTADGPLHPSGRAILNFGVRGMAGFDLVVRTGRTDAHSGNHGGTMPNAIWTLVHLLATMKTPDGRITIDGLHDPIVPPTEAERAAAAACRWILTATCRKWGWSGSTRRRTVPS
jgi:acetylornithine deacetylase/succinyl-diaminopimelate desuccinylase-like protein